MVDDNQAQTAWACDALDPCLRLHNGGTLHYYHGSFGGTATTNAVTYEFDPDGRETIAGSTNSPGKAVQFWLYYDGRIRTWATLRTGTATQGAGPFTVDAAKDPPWFSFQ